jgi:ubiquinone/menaquinone biosynthesis C-methylase UbiE
MWKKVNKNSKKKIAAGEQQDFFGQAARGEHAPLKPLEENYTPQQQSMLSIFNKHKGHFDEHIETSIPHFRKNSLGKMNAIVQSHPQNARMLDIASSEGSLGKTITEASGGRIQTTNLDPQEQMINTFKTKSKVPGAESVSAAFGASFEDENGKIVPKFAPPHSYDVVHESMAFQFFGPEREEHIAEAKRLLAPDGIFLSEEKVRTDNEAENEAKKDAWKAQYHSPEALQRKQEQVGFQGEDTGGGGMMDKMVHQDVLESLLKKYFKYVVQYWSSGNFKGYAASDSKDKINAYVNNYEFEPHQFETEKVPRQLNEPSKQSKWKTAANAATEQRIQKIVEQAQNKGLKVVEHDNDGYLMTDIHIGEYKYTEEPIFLIYIYHGKNRTMSIVYDKEQTLDYRTNLGAIEKTINSLEKENFDQYAFFNNSELFNHNNILWNRHSKWKTVESQDANRMYRQHTDGPPAAETTFESIQNEDTSEEHEDEEIIVNGKKWKMVRRKNNPQPDTYKDPIGGWGFYSKLIDEMEKQPWVIVSAEKAKSIDVANINQYYIPRNYRIINDIVPNFSRYGVIPIARRGSYSDAYSLTDVHNSGRGRFDDHTYTHNIYLYDPENRQIVYGMDYMINGPNAFDYHSEEDRFSGYPEESLEEKYAEHKYPTYVDSIHYFRPTQRDEQDEQFVFPGDRIYLSALNDKGHAVAHHARDQEVVDQFNKRYPRLSLAALRWIKDELPKPIGAEIINPKLEQKAQKQDFVSLSKWKLSVPPAEKAEEYAKGYEQSDEPTQEYLEERYKWNPEVRGHRWKLNYKNLEKVFNHPDFPVSGKYNVFTVDPKSAPTEDTSMKHWRRTPLGSHEAASPNRAGTIHINPLISAESANEALWHELQHAYQDQEGRFTPELREKYFNPTDISGLSDEEVDRKFKENYLEHPMEIDANKFADFMRQYPLIEESEPVYKSRWVNFSMANKDVDQEIKSIIDRYYEEHGSKRRLPLPSIESKWKKKSTYLPGFYSTALVPDEENGGYKMLMADDERMTHWGMHPADGTFPSYRGLYNRENKQLLHLSSPEEYEANEFKDLLPGPTGLKASPEEHAKVWIDAAKKGVSIVSPTMSWKNDSMPESVIGLLDENNNPVNNGKKVNITKTETIKLDPLNIHVMHKRPELSEEFKFKATTPEENNDKYWHQISFSSPASKQSKWKLAGETKTKLLERAAQLPEDSSEIIHQFDNGWTIRELKTVGDHYREGQLMGNCVSNNVADHIDWDYLTNEYDQWLTPEEIEECENDGTTAEEMLEEIFLTDPSKYEKIIKEYAKDYRQEPAWKSVKYHSLRDENNLPHVSFGGGYALGRHNSEIKDEYKKYLDFFPKESSVMKEAPARSKAQFRYMQGICNGSIEPPEGMTRAQACEYVEGQSPKDLPEKKSKWDKIDIQQKMEKELINLGFSKKAAILMALDNISKLSYWVDGYHATVALRDPETDVWHMDVGFNDKLTHGGVTADYINDLGTKAMRESVADKDSRTDYYNYHTARGLYNPTTKDFIHMSHPDFWNEAEYNFKSLDQEERDRMEAFWKQLAEQNGIEVDSIRVLNNQTGHIEDLNVADLEMPHEVKRTLMLRERNRPLTPWEREHGGYDTKTGNTKTSHWIKGYNAAIINQDGKMEIAESDPDRIYYDDEDDDEPTREWHETHWDIGGMPKWRGLYNPKTQDLIHMTSPEEYHKITNGEGEWYDFAENNRPEYPFEEEAINPEGHKNVWVDAATEAGIPVNSVRLMYADRNQTRKNYNNQNDETDFNIKTSHWIDGFHAAIINQHGELEIAPPRMKILDGDGNLLEEDEDTTWAATHWDLAGYPQYRGLYNHKTGELIHMTSPKEYESMTQKNRNQEYLYPGEGEDVSSHQAVWMNAANKKNIPIREFNLFYGNEEHDEEYGTKYWRNENKKQDFNIVKPEESVPKQSNWKKRGHWLEGYHAAVIAPSGEMRVAKDWNQFHGSLLPDANIFQRAQRGYHRGLYNSETGQLLHMTTPKEWKMLEDSWGSHEEEDSDVRWPLGFEWIRDPQDFISPYQTEKAWLKAAEESGTPVSGVKFFSGEPEINPYIGFDVNDFNLHSPQEIAAKYGKWKVSKKDAWEAVLDGKLGHDIITTGTWEEVKKQTIKWLKQLKDGYINKKNPHDNDKIDPDAKEQDGHALEDLKLYEEKKRWSFHFDHGKHPYDLIIQPVGYKESKWKKRSHWVEGFHAAGITPEGDMVVGPKWTTYHGELKTPNSIYKTFEPHAGWRGLYNPDTNELLHLTTPDEYERFGYTESAEDLEDFKNPHEFYRDAWQKAADKSNYPVENISLFVDKNSVNPADRNDRDSFDLTKIGKWKIADKKKKIHPKFQTSLKDHQRSIRKYGPLKTHKVRNFKKKSVLNEQQAKELFEYEPYMYHDVAAARGKADIRDQIETVKSIMNNGILPKEETGVSEYDDWLTSRPHHVYIGRRGFYQRTMPPAIRINMSKIDPSTLKPDEDIYHAFGFSDKHKDEIDMHELKSAPFEEEHRNNPDYTLGKWMDDNAHLDTPKNVLASYGLNNSLAVLGGVPSDALEINPEWVEKIKERHGIDITKML